MQERFVGKRGADLIAIRDRLGVTQRAVAAAMDTTATTLYRWERDMVKVTPLMYARYEAAAHQVFEAKLAGDAA